MAATLPANTQLKLQQVLSQWQHWDSKEPLLVAPTVQHQIGSGRSNLSWLVAAGERQFVLRLDGQDPQRLGLSRPAEWRAHQNAHKQSLAPKPLYFNPELGALVTAFYPADTDTTHPLTEVAALLRGIHGLAPVKFRLRPLQRAQHYLVYLGHEQPEAAFVAACERASNSEQCLCHNDLLQANRLAGAAGLLAIDWEYAAMGNPWYDLAAICEGDSLSDQQCLEMVASYLQRKPKPAELDQLSDNRLIYLTLCDYWQRLTEL
ncbi:choline/ethanolamine kinase family protein [Candidatus Litorirhabdus singularis]|nr:phosphotransferase family protein [Candidatus Litorirhabdus singularis]